MNLIIPITIIALSAIIIRKLIFDSILMIKNYHKINLKVHICPICKSNRVINETTGLEIGFQMKCKDCGYQGTMLEMNIDEADEIREELNRALID